MGDIKREYRGLRFTLHSVDAEREQFIVERISDGIILTSTLHRPENARVFDALVDEWIAERLGVPEPPAVHCQSCSTRLVPSLRNDTDYQFDGALWLQFDGGYGMFVDPFEEDTPRAVICHDCAHELCTRVPWIAALLEPERSHSHRSDHIEKLILEGHRGWDIDSTRLDEGPGLEAHLRETHLLIDLPENPREQWALHQRAHQGNAGTHRH